jgi:hypothetical protein
MSEENYHNKGQEDASEGKFDPPRNPLSAPVWSEQDRQDWNDYKAGHDHTRSQQDD